MKSPNKVKKVKIERLTLKDFAEYQSNELRLWVIYMKVNEIIDSLPIKKKSNKRK